MKPKSKVLIRDSFAEVDIVEPGFHRNINATLYSNNFMQPQEMEFSLQDVVCDLPNSLWCLSHYIDWSEWNTCLTNSTGYTYSDEFDIVQREDGNDMFLFYPHTESATYYPWMVESDASLFASDQGFAFEIKKTEVGENQATTAKLFIAISGISPAVIQTVGGTLASGDTIIFEFPLYEKKPIRYGFAAYASVTSSITELEDVCGNNVYNLDNNIANVQSFLNEGTSTIFTLRRLWNLLLVNSNTIATSVVVSNSSTFTMVTPRIKVIQTSACPIYFRIGDIKYATSGTISVKIPLGTTLTETPECHLETRLNASDAASTITATSLAIDGLYLKGTLTFATNNAYYSPALYAFNLVIPPSYSNNSGGNFTDLSNIVIGWSITKQDNQAPSATISLDNSVFDYSYADFVAIIGKQVRIQCGYEGSTYQTRFTGTIDSVDFVRDSPASCQVTLTCNGLTARLDKECMYERIYDGENHQTAIADICQSAYIANVIVQTPANDDSDKLGYGIDNPKYHLKPGDTYREKAKQIQQYSGYVLEEDELGQAIYLPKYWRYYGFGGSITKYGNADEANVNIQTIHILNTTDYGYSTYYRNPISSLKITRNHDDLRNVIIVVGTADRIIDYNYSWYPAYKPGDAIIRFKENADLIAYMKQKVPLVVNDPSLTHPEQVDFVADALLKLYGDVEQQCSLTVLGDEYLHVGSINVLEDNVMIGENLYLVINSMTEKYENNIYLMDIQGTLTTTMPVQYV